MDATQFDPTLRERLAYRFWVKEHVRFTDLDALGHVSAVRTNEYFNSARASLFQQAIDQWPNAARQLPVLKLSIVLNEQEMHFPLELDVGLAIERWGKSSLTMVLAAFGPECCALSRNVFVFIDAVTRAPVPPDEAIRENFTRLAGSPIASSLVA
jgi:acyl-CoA thioester hydrolase